MPIANCSECQKAFNKLTSVNVCPECRQLEEDAFDQCYQFLRTHPRASVAEVAEGTGIEESKILKFLRSGKLVSSAGYPCQSCSSLITAGALCTICSNGLRSQVAETAPQGEQGARSGYVRRDLSHATLQDRYRH